MGEGKLTGSIQVLSGLLQVRTGQFLSESRMWRLETSLKPLLRTHGLANLDMLVDRLLSDGGGPLADEIVDALLNNETSFYRDQHVFQTIVRNMLPQIAATRPDKVLRIWSAGCSTGQEAYSLAMAFRKEPALWEGWRIQILATDISNTAIARAQSGLYSQIDVQRGLAINDLLRWFEPQGEEWRISSEVRGMVDFRVDNLFECKVPSGQYDLVLCRNVLLYFSTEMRRQVFDKVAQYCAPGGHLVLGAGETVIGQSDDFAASQTFRGMYQRSAKPVSDHSAGRAVPACDTRRNNAA